MVDFRKKENNEFDDYEVETVLPNGSMVLKDGSIQFPRQKDICENCGEYLCEEDKYCYNCGSKRGKGGFFPAQNNYMLLYGPDIYRFYKCKKCGSKWKTGKYDNFCRKCGTKNPKLYYEVEIFPPFSDYGIVNEPKLKEILKYKINNFEEKINKFIKRLKDNKMKKNELKDNITKKQI